jgi:hypothetical protein
MYMAVYEVAPRWGKNQNEHLSQEKILNLMGVDAVAEHDLKELGNNLLNLLVELEKGLNNK